MKTKTQFFQPTNFHAEMPELTKSVELGFSIVFRTHNWLNTKAYHSNLPGFIRARIRPWADAFYQLRCILIDWNTEKIKEYGPAR